METDVDAAEPELEGLTGEQRQEAFDVLQLRRRAASLAARLELDPGDVYHQLRQFRRSPVERLRRGLAHGQRRRIPE